MTPEEAFPLINVLKFLDQLLAHVLLQQLDVLINVIKLLKKVKEFRKSSSFYPLDHPMSSLPIV